MDRVTFLILIFSPELEIRIHNKKYRIFRAYSCNLEIIAHDRKKKSVLVEKNVFLPLKIKFAQFIFYQQINKLSIEIKRNKNLMNA